MAEEVKEQTSTRSELSKVCHGPDRGKGLQ